MVKDHMGNELKPGDKVVQLTIMYNVSCVSDTDNKFALKEAGSSLCYEGVQWLKVCSPVGGNSDIIKVAEAILKLNNARPRNPFLEEIVACLEALK